MKARDIFLIIFLALIIFGSGFIGGRHSARSGAEYDVQSDTTSTKDTSSYYEPEPIAEKPVASVTDILPIVKTGNIKPGNIPISGNIDEKNIPILEELDSIGTHDSPADSAEVEIPITQKVYEDSTYRAVISGYNVSLDSMLVYSQHDVVTKTKTYKPKRWSIGIQVGYGMTLKGTPQFSPYIGVGIQYNIFSW